MVEAFVFFSYAMESKKQEAGFPDSGNFHVHSKIKVPGIGKWTSSGQVGAQVGGQVGGQVVDK